jgi:hypothetical protein
MTPLFKTPVPKKKKKKKKGRDWEMIFSWKGRFQLDAKEDSWLLGSLAL